MKFILITILQVYLKFHFVTYDIIVTLFLELKKGKSEVEICINKQTFPFKPVMQSSVVYTDVYAVFYENNWFNLRKPEGKNDSLLKLCYIC